MGAPGKVKDEKEIKEGTEKIRREPPVFQFGCEVLVQVPTADASSSGLVVVIATTR